METPQTPAVNLTAHPAQSSLALLASTLAAFRTGWRTSEAWVSAFSALAPFLLALLDKLPAQMAAIISGIAALGYHIVRGTQKSNHSDALLDGLRTLAEHIESTPAEIAPPVEPVAPAPNPPGNGGAVSQAAPTTIRPPAAATAAFIRPGTFLITAALSALACLLFGCAALMKIKTAYTTDRAATVAALKADAIGILGKVAVAELANLAQQQLAPEMMHSAAAAVWSAVDAGDIARLVNDATGNAAPALAQKAGALAQQAIAGGAKPQAAFNAIASAVSAAAFTGGLAK